MNSGQTAAATLGGAVLAESLIGGIGIGMLGTAVGIPAAAVVATVGGIATASKGLEEQMPNIRAWANNRASVYWLKKDATTILFRVNARVDDDAFNKGSHTIRFRNNRLTDDKETYVPIKELRAIYKSYLDQGYKPVDKP